MKTFVKFLLQLFITVTPKFRWCVLRGFPDYDDNCLAIYERLADYPYKKIIWVVADLRSTRPFMPRPGTVFVERSSLLDYFYSIFSKYLFITHGHFVENIPENQICVNLWHGIPYKVIGKLDGRSGRQDSIVVATSELTRGVFSKVFGVSLDKVVVTGQARTDRMFTNPEVVRARLGIPLDAETKVFLWLPTYRKTDVNGSRLDGRDAGNVFNCTEFPSADFHSFLQANNAICLVKPHPMAPSVDRSASMSNLLFIDDQWLRDREISLYQLLGSSDCLISDISSIVIDFLLVDKPIVLLFEDIAEYGASRGFVFSPLEEWLPARVNTNYSHFIEDLTEVINGADPYSQSRSRLKHAFFEYNDAQSATRILDRTFHNA